MNVATSRASTTTASSARHQQHHHRHKWQQHAPLRGPCVAEAYVGRHRGGGGRGGASSSAGGGAGGDEGCTCAVFQLYPHAEVNMNDVRDAIEACECTKKGSMERSSCFETFGLRARQVDSFFAVVDDLERHYAADDEAGRRVASFGGLLFCMLLAHKLL